MEQIGTVKFVQIQQNPLKLRQADGTRRYHPQALIQLHRIRLTAQGIVGLTDADDRLLDVHHSQHPHSRYRGDNSISLGLTAHYEEMRARFGNHIREGMGGENIIVSSSRIITPSDMGKRIAIQSSARDSLIYLGAVMPIPPCEPFSQFLCARALSPQETKSTLQFLSGGMRGYYMALETAAPEIIIQAGDAVYSCQA